MTLDVHPNAPMDEKGDFVVREQHSFPHGARVFQSGTRIRAHRKWVSANASHLLQSVEEWEAAKNATEADDFVETVDAPVSDTGARTKATRRSPRSK